MPNPVATTSRTEDCAAPFGAITTLSCAMEQTAKETNPTESTKVKKLRQNTRLLSEWFIFRFCLDRCQAL
jgi:hypothetical protein